MSLRHLLSKTLLPGCLLLLLACGTAPSEPDHSQQLREAIYSQDDEDAKKYLDTLQRLKERLHQRADTTQNDSAR